MFPKTLTWTHCPLCPAGDLLHKLPMLLSCSLWTVEETVCRSPLFPGMTRYSGTSWRHDSSCTMDEWTVPVVLQPSLTAQVVEALECRYTLLCLQPKTLGDVFLCWFRWFSWFLIGSYLSPLIHLLEKFHEPCGPCWNQQKKWAEAAAACAMTKKPYWLAMLEALLTYSSVAMWQFGMPKWDWMANGFKWQRFRGMTRGTGALLQPTSQPHVLVPVEAPAVCTPGGWRPAGDLGNVRWSWPWLWTQATSREKYIEIIHNS